MERNDVSLRCRCGQIRGRVRGVGPDVGNRCVCYCDSCQAFGHFLDAREVLDPRGGTDIYQISPAQVEIEAGHDQIACLHLREGGLFRWYARCCRTALCNTMKGSLPFIGLIHTFMDHEADGRTRDEALGPIRGTNVPEAARGEPLPTTGAARLGMLWRIGKIVVGGRWRGDQARSPLFVPETGAPICEPQVLSAEQLAEVEAARDRFPDRAWA